MQNKADSKNLNNNTSIWWCPVEKVCKITPRRLELLHQLKIFSVFDLLLHFPQKYEDWRTRTLISDICDMQEVMVQAEIVRAPSLSRKGKWSVLRTTLADPSGAVAAVWFNQPYYKSMLEKDQTYLFRGMVRKSGQGLELINPKFQRVSKDVDRSIRPVYKSVKGLPQSSLRDWINKILSDFGSEIFEPIAHQIMKKKDLCSAEFAYKNIHFPIDEKTLEMARKRLAFEELFMLLSGLIMLKREGQNNKHAYRILLDDMDAGIIKHRIDALPFDLTEDQRNVIKDVLKDMSRSHPMNRLVQGDVGSGKTIVAAVAMHACAQKGFQSVFLVPTSVLAQQHYKVIKEYLSSEDIVVDLLLGSTKDKERREIRQRLKKGITRILIGTHAVFSEKNHFNNLALLVTDEQHRFGVRQRALLKENNSMCVHTLVMSATPIPRTLGLILYADMDISIITSCPAGRQKIETYLTGAREMSRVFEIAKRQIDRGRQVYYVCPMIDDEEDEGLPAAQDIYHRFTHGVFSDYRVGLMHGAQKAEEKEAVMRLFSEGQIDILVSTTVIEVGVDNPNASLMIIDHAEFFGLSTLHQLRGRIGRGPHRSVCILISDSESEKAIERLRYLCSTTDGFALAQKDLDTRGPGDFFGSAQHGLPQMQFAQFYTNMTEIKSMCSDIDWMLNDKEEKSYLYSSDWHQVFKHMFRRFVDCTEL